MSDTIYHFVYKTTCLANNKVYIGVHSTRDLKDGYLGSGSRILPAIKKYGRENFKREILKFFDERADAYEYESVLVTESFVKEKTNYNVDPGGAGRRCNFTNGKDHHWYDKKHSEKTLSKMREQKRGKNNPFYGKKHGGDLSRFGHQKNCVKCFIDGKEYSALKDIAKDYGVSKALVSKWVKQGKVRKFTSGA